MWEIEQKTVENLVWVTADYLFLWIIDWHPVKLQRCYLYCSSLSTYVHNLENLTDVSDDEHQALDVFIDELYEEMDKGDS